MSLKQPVAVLRKWIWLIPLAAGIAAGASYLATRQMPKVYQASTMLLVGQSLQNPNPSTELLNISQQLAQTYVQLVPTVPFLQNAVDDLGAQMTTDQLRDQVNARNIPGTALIEIRVVDTDPLRAQALANEMARQLILLSPASNEPSDPQRNFVQKQVDEIQRNIEEAQNKIKELQSPTILTGSREVVDNRQQISTLQNQVNIWEQTYAEFLTYLAPRAANYVSVIDPARVPDKPIAPNIPLYVLSSATIGIALAVCGIFVIEYLDGKRQIS
jgi:tyrosine-protein kinase